MALVQMSDYLENKLLDHAFRNTTYTAPTSVWIALFTSGTGLETNNQSNEVTGTGYARLEVGAATGRDFTAAASRGTENNEDWQFANPGGSWGTVTSVAVMDASTTGEILMYCDLTVARSIVLNDDVIFSAGELQFLFNETPDQISDHLAHELLDHTLKNSAYTPIATLYVALFTADSGLAQNTQTGEVGSGVGYSRQTVAFNAAAAGLVDNTAEVLFGPNTTTNWGTISHMAVIDASTAGNVLMTKALDVAAAVIVADSLRFAAGDLDLVFN